MPKGRRETALIALVKQLDTLDAKRRTLVTQIQAAANQLGGDTAKEIPAPRRRRGGRRKGFKMSAAAKAKISAAAKKRHASNQKLKDAGKPPMK